MVSGIVTAPRCGVPRPSAVTRVLTVLAAALFATHSAWAQGADAAPAVPESPNPAARPLWEAGLAVVGVRGPDYPAAGSTHNRAAVVPIVIYRGERLRVDDEGVRGRLLNTGEFELDISAAAAFNARDSPARAGMPGLDYTFELGPQAIYRRNLGGGQQLSAHLQLRGVFSTDWGSIEGRGYVVQPELRWRQRGWPLAGSQVQLSAQATWASEELQRYFYQVDPAYATSTRATYDARAGYFGAALRASWSQRLSPSMAVSLGLTLNDHHGAANRDSPLFQRERDVQALVAFVWTPWRGGGAGEP